MIERTSTALGVVIALATSSTAFACSCLPIEFFVRADSWACEAFAGAGYVVHGEVVSVGDGHKARVRVLEDFKGQNRNIDLTASDAPSSMCGTEFKLGETYIYLVSKKGEINLCSRYLADNLSLSAMRAMAARMGPNITAQTDARETASRAAGCKR